MAILIAAPALFMTWTTVRDMQSLRGHLRIARSLDSGISELTLLTRTMMQNPSDQTKEQWHIAMDSMDAALDLIQCQHGPGQQRGNDILSSLAELRGSVQRRFEPMVSRGAGSDAEEVSEGLAEDSWAGLFAHLSAMNLSVHRFQELHEDLFSAATNRAIAWGVGCIGLLLLLLTASVVMLNVSAVRPLNRLRQGMAAVAAGDLQYRVDTKRRDEFGTIERAFDDMTARLQATLASRDELREEVQHRRQAEDALRERIKELDCLRKTEQILADRTLSQRDVLKRIVDLMPESWLHSDTACARIRLDDTQAATDNYRAPQASQLEDIIIDGRKAGEIEVGYLDERPTADEGPFLKEERDLLESLSERIGHHLEQSQMLSHSETRFRQLLTLAPVPMAHVNGDGELIYINNRFTETYGYDLDDVPDLNSWWPAAFPDANYRQWAQETWSADIERAAAQGTDIAAREYRLTCKDGSVRFADIGGVVIGEEYLVIFVDRTERDRAVRSLRESEQRFRLLAEASLTGICIVQDGIFVEVNSAFTTIFGYDAGEIVGRLGPMDLTVPEDRPLAETYANRLMTGDSSGEVLANRARRKDGSIVWLEIRARKIQYREAPAIIGNIVDVTERRRSELALAENERRYRGIFNTAPVSIWEEDWTDVVDLVRQLAREHEDMAAYLARHPEVVREALAKVRIVDVNEATVSMFGARDKDELLDSLAPIFATPDALSGFAGELCALASGEPFYKTEMQLCTVDGDTIHTLLTMAFPEPDSSSGTVLVSLMDLTARKAQEEEQKRLTEELERKNRELSQVIYVTSHDLRSPLVNIQGFSRELKASLDELSTLLESTTPADQAGEQLDFLLREDIPGSLDYILNSASRMDRLLAGLLKISRLGRTALTIEAIDMEKLIAEIVESMRFQLRQFDGRVTVGDLPRCAGDAGQIEQVFSNLLDNAVKYSSPDRPLRIRVSGRRRATDAVYCVEDNGCGIDPKHQEKIFELFHRLSPQDSAGEGLGLTSVRTILDRHRGSIWVESEPDCGSRFYISLPLRPAVGVIHSSGHEMLT